MAIFHTQVAMHGFEFEDSHLTVKLNSAITAADIGKALSQDTTADNTVKLAADGDIIVGVLSTFEDRTIEGQKIGTMKMRFASKLPIKSGLSGAKVVARGKLLCGAGAGEVRAIDPATDTTIAQIRAPRVWAVSGLVASATLI